MVASVIGLALLLGDVADRGARRDGRTEGLIPVCRPRGASQPRIRVVCLLKGKITTGLLGLPMPFTAWWGRSAWPKPVILLGPALYPAASMAKPQERFGPRYQARRERLRDLVSGQGRRR